MKRGDQLPAVMFDRIRFAASGSGIFRMNRSIPDRKSVV